MYLILIAWREKLSGSWAFSRMELYWDTVSCHPKTINLLFKQRGTLKIYMRFIEIRNNWKILSCRQSFANIVRLQQNTLQKGWRSVISSEIICVKMWRILMNLFGQKFPNFSTSRILTGIVETIRIDTKRQFTVKRKSLCLRNLDS